MTAFHRPILTRYVGISVGYAVDIRLPAIAG